MQDVRPFVVPEHMGANHVLQLRVKMGKEAEVAQQHPIKEQDVVDLHGIEHAQKPDEKAQKTEIIPDAVPNAEGRRT